MDSGLDSGILTGLQISCRLSFTKPALEDSRTLFRFRGQRGTDQNESLTLDRDREVIVIFSSPCHSAASDSATARNKTSAT